MSLGMRHLLRMRGNGGLETIAALDVVAEHVEARARGRQQHGVAGARLRDRARHGSFQSRREFDRRLHAGQRRCDRRARRGPAARPRGSARRRRIRSGEKSCPLPSPPAIKAAGRSMPSSAASVAATVVAFESFTKSTPPISATRSMRCGRPRNAASAASTLPSIVATVDVSASAASAFSALWRPTSASSLVRNSSVVPRASQSAPSCATSPQSWAWVENPRQRSRTGRSVTRIASDRAIVAIEYLRHRRRRKCAPLAAA